MDVMLPMTQQSTDDKRAGAILEWFVDNAKDFPWRHTHDAWSILVSEVMLTQAEPHQVRHAFRPFLNLFPNATTCARAPVDEVIRAWSELGDEQCAVNLHHCAKLIESENGGRFPETIEDLQRLPGVNPTIARAVAVFAFDGRACVLDSIAARVITRWSGRPMSQRELQALADALVPPGASWAWNHALSDFGSKICTAEKPSCGICPVRESCSWAGRNADPAVD